jgi:hypothetical protein
MQPLRPFCSRGWLGLCLGLAVIPTPGLAQAPADTSGAAQAVRDYLAAAARDGGRLWGRSLKGPMILVDPAARTSVATERPPGGMFRQVHGIWLGTIPEGIPTANFALTWAGRRWAMVLLPLPEDRFIRLSLLLHEAFHGIQEQLGLSGPDYLNPHLDERDGRFWLRLELRAMATALRSDGTARASAARDALLFRAQRQALYPGADTLERALELAEGLAEYTGTRLALTQLGLPVSRAAELLQRFERRTTYVRSLGYGTGPGLGLLLDVYVPGWRRRVAREGLASQLGAGLRFRAPPDLSASARTAATRYDADALGLEEDARARARAEALADYRRRLIDGPVLTLRQAGLQRAFNPNTLVAAGADGTVYPTGTFGAAWGSLEVERGGALVSTDFTVLRLPAPSDTAGPVIRGEGWTLRLSEGWRLAPGDRAGDWVAVPRK